MSQPVSVYYRNHRGECGWRRIEPLQIWHGATEWHPVPQWLLKARDLDRGAERDFAMCHILKWMPGDRAG